jgi:hypothetical protein
MKRSIAGHERRVRRLKVKLLSDADDHFRRCTIFGCGEPTQRAAKAGLATTLCRKHLLHRQRHGSPWCRSPPAGALHPYLRAAQSFIDLRRRDAFINAALTALRRLMEAAGEVVIATRLKGRSPEQRAKVALARLRDAEVKPERLLAIGLALHCLIEEAPQVVHRIKEWRIVAIAKAAHRLASGTHRQWKDDQGNVLTEMHCYPRSSGRVLRYLGEMIEQECELVIDHHLAAVLALKIDRYGRRPARVEPLSEAFPIVRPTPR